jgi:enoyl-CoA hydratase
MPYHTVLFAVEGRVATLTFNRPDKLNALNPEMWSEMSAVLTKVSQTPEIRVLILTGQGRAFIAGADIQLFPKFSPLEAARYSKIGQDVLFQMEELPIPVIAAVNGFALGGGCEVAMAADIIFAAEEAKFGQPEINLALIPGFGGTQRLSRLVGLGRARELCLTGRTIDAAEARASGLVARVFPGAALLEESLKVARGLADKGRTALHMMKQVLDRGFDQDLRSAIALENDAFGLCFSDPDAQEGAAAFLEKRKPKFA